MNTHSAYELHRATQTLWNNFICKSFKMDLNASSATALSGLLMDILAEQILNDIRGCRLLQCCVLFCEDRKKALSLASQEASIGGFGQFGIS